MKPINAIFTFMLVVLLATVLISCKKDAVLTDSIKTKIAQSLAATAATAGVQNIGKPFTSTNVLTKLDPLNPNHSPLITFNSNSNTGYNFVMIDNGKTDGQTPLHAFRLIAVNLNNNTYNTVKIKNTAGAEVTNSVGRVVRYVFGSNKKLYVATEGSFGGGGHIIEYDANKQTAVDLGKPFLKSGRRLDIYSLNVGVDGSLYGGSFGGSGDVMTFRYNYNGQFDVDATALDNSSRYVSYVSGDAYYTYASCGENAWKLYAINKVTKAKKVLLQNSNPDNRIDLNTYTDAVYANLINTHYKLQNNTAKSLGASNTPQTNELRYTIYPAETIKNMTVGWNEFTRVLSYVLPTGATGSLQVYDIETDTYPTGDAAFVNNQLFIAAANRSLLARLDNSSWNVLGTTGIDINSLASANNNSDLFISGYPKGKLLTFKTAQPWTLNLTDNSDPFTSEITGTNPSATTMLQTTDGAGNNGPMVVSKMVVTKAGYMVAAGDDDRITSTSGRQLAISSFKNGVTKNAANSALAQYQFSGMCLSADSNLAYISAVSISGSQGRIFVYNPATNSIVNSFAFPNKSAGKIITADSKTIAGFYDEVVYLFDVTTGTIINKQILGGGQRVYGMAKDITGTIYFTHLYLQATHFKIQKMNFTRTGSTVNTTLATVTEFSDTDNDEETKPTGLTFAPNSNSFYITGLRSIYRLQPGI